MADESNYETKKVDENGEVIYNITDDLAEGNYRITATYTDDGENGSHHYNSSSNETLLTISSSQSMIKLDSTSLTSKWYETFQPIVYISKNNSPVSGVSVNFVMNYKNPQTEGETYAKTIGTGTSDENGKIIMSEGVELRPENVVVSSTSVDKTYDHAYLSVSLNDTSKYTAETVTGTVKIMKRTLTYTSTNSYVLNKNDVFQATGTIVDSDNPQGCADYVSQVPFTLQLGGVGSTQAFTVGAQGSYSCTVPTALNSGKYYVYIRTDGNEAYAPSVQYTNDGKVPVLFVKAEYKLETPSTTKVREDGSVPLQCTVKNDLGNNQPLTDGTLSCTLTDPDGGAIVDSFTGLKTDPSTGICYVNYAPKPTAPYLMNIGWLVNASDEHTSASATGVVYHQQKPTITISCAGLKYNTSCPIKINVKNSITQNLEGIRCKIYLSKTKTDVKTEISSGSILKTDSNGNIIFNYTLTNPNYAGDYVLTVESVYNDPYYLASSSTLTIPVMKVLQIKGDSQVCDESYDASQQVFPINYYDTNQTSTVTLTAHIYDNKTSDDSLTPVEGVTVTALDLINPSTGLVIQSLLGENETIKSDNTGLVTHDYTIPFGELPLDVSVRWTISQVTSGTSEVYHTGMSGRGTLRVRRYIYMEIDTDELVLNTPDTVDITNMVDSHGEDLTNIKIYLGSGGTVQKGSIKLFEGLSSSDNEINQSINTNVWKTSSFSLTKYRINVWCATNKYVNKGTSMDKNGDYVFSKVVQLKVVPTIEVLVSTESDLSDDSFEPISNNALVGGDSATLRFRLSYPNGTAGTSYAANVPVYVLFNNNKFLLDDKGNTVASKSTGDKTKGYVQQEWNVPDGLRYVNNQFKVWVDDSVVSDDDKQNITYKSTGTQSFNVKIKKHTIFHPSSDPIYMTLDGKLAIDGYLTDTSGRRLEQAKDIVFGITASSNHQLSQIVHMKDSTGAWLTTKSQKDDAGTYSKVSAVWDKTETNTEDTYNLQANTKYAVYVICKDTYYIPTDGNYVNMSIADMLTVQCTNNTQFFGTIRGQARIVYNTNPVAGLKNITIKSDKLKLNGTNLSTDSKGYVSTTSYESINTKMDNAPFTVTVPSQTIGKKTYLEATGTGKINIRNGVYVITPDSTSLEVDGSDEFATFTATIKQNGSTVQNIDGFKLYSIPDQTDSGVTATTDANGKLSIKYSLLSPDTKKWYTWAYRVYIDKTEDHEYAQSSDITVTFKHPISSYMPQISQKYKSGVYKSLNIQLWDGAYAMTDSNRAKGTYTAAQTTFSQDYTMSKMGFYVYIKKGDSLLPIKKTSSGASKTFYLNIKSDGSTYLDTGESHGSQWYNSEISTKGTYDCVIKANTSTWTDTQKKLYSAKDITIPNVFKVI